MSHVNTKAGLGALVALALGVLVVLLLVQAGGGTALAGKPPKPTPTPTPTPATLASLATDPAPWLHIEAGSDQRPPAYLGSKPREMELGLQPADGGIAKLPMSSKALGEQQLKNIWQCLYAAKLITSKTTIIVEAWPTRDDRSRPTWAFARWRTSTSAPWRWLGPYDTLNTDPDGFTPVLWDPADPSDYHDVFDDFSTMGMYTKPIFSDCVWVPRQADQSLAVPTQGWLPSSQRESFAQRGDLASLMAYQLPQPARLNGVPIEYGVIKVKGGAVTWPSSITWVADPAVPAADDRDPVITDWGTDFAGDYQTDLKILDAELPGIFTPIMLLGYIGPDGMMLPDYTTLPRKSCAQPDHQLMQTVEYLEARYAQLGLETRRQSFEWRGIAQASLIVELPGTNPSADPVLMADHIDTAYAEDVYQASQYQTWETVAGADDNCSASAALLRAGEVLKDVQHERPIWLVHFTGEEFPSDCLGARALVSSMLTSGQDIAGLVLLDMVGYTGWPVIEGDYLMQLSPGDSTESLAMAAVALDAVYDVTEHLAPQLEPRSSDRSYIYNTDGVIFADTGYPVVLVNEHVNYYSLLMREGYHDSTDLSYTINFPYAVEITKASIETVARLAGPQPQ
jgi:hypothetical protein